jgi:hypothetical protein
MGDLGVEVDDFTRGLLGCAYEAHRANPHLARMMKACGVTAQNVRDHGAASIPVNPKLRELAEGTRNR